MLSDHQAPELHFAGLGAGGATAAEAAEALAAELRRWTAEHEDCRMVQLAVTPAPTAATHPEAPAFNLSALIVYLNGALGSEDAAQAVAAAVQELQQAQAPAVELPEDDPPRFV